MVAASTITSGQVQRPPAAGGSQHRRRQEPTPDEIQRLRRRVALFRRAGVIGDCDPRIQIRRAMTADELKAAYALLHEVFVTQGFIAPMAGGLRVRIFEALPEMATFIATVDGRVVGVMSVVPDSPDLGLPSDKAFSQELDPLRKRGCRLSEITNLAVAPEYRNSSVLMELSRSVYAYARWMRLDNFFISISPSHSKFFESILQFMPCGDLRNYGDDTVDMVEGKLFDISNGPANWQAADKLLGQQAFLYDWFEASNPNHRTMGDDAARFGRMFLDAYVLRDLFVESSDLLKRSTTQHRQALCRRWGVDLYRDAVGLADPEVEDVVASRFRRVVSWWDRTRWMWLHRLFGRLRAAMML